jgi:hypothetical protein
VFRPFEEEDETTGRTQKQWLPMLTYALFQLIIVGLGLYKCSAMGLLPGDPQQWKHALFASPAAQQVHPLNPTSPEPCCSPCGNSRDSISNRIRTMSNTLRPCDPLLPCVLS